MKKSNAENTFKKEKNNPINILEYLFFYDIDCSNSEEVKKKMAHNKKNCTYSTLCINSFFLSENIFIVEN